LHSARHLESENIHSQQQVHLCRLTSLVEQTALVMRHETCPVSKASRFMILR
jgi:hypothetical protein